MKISVAVKTNSKTESVTWQADGSYLARVRVQPIEGRANERIRELLAEHFGLPKSKIQIVSGLKSKKKVFEIS